MDKPVKIEKGKLRPNSILKPKSDQDSNISTFKEKQWNPNFQVMCSKDNEFFHFSKKEYFDKPLFYHPLGLRSYLF